MKYRSEYRYTRRFGNPYHTYLVIGRHGAIHFHVTEYGEETRRASPTMPEFTAGLEVHYRQPPDYMSEQPPSHDECWAIKCPCWHDGTSLYAEETLLPMWLAVRSDPERVLQMLESEADGRWAREKETAS